MLSFAILSIHRQVCFALNVYRFTKVTRIMFCLPLSHIVVYRDTDIVYLVSYHVVDFEKAFDPVHRIVYRKVLRAKEFHGKQSTWYKCYTKIVNVQC